MANPFRKGWKYLMSSFDAAIDENADPQVQLNQAEEAARAQHQQVASQAATIIGQRTELEMKINRLVEDRTKLEDQSRRAVRAADDARAAGDEQKAAEFDSAAEVLVSQLVAVEKQLEEHREHYSRAEEAAEHAKNTVQQSEARLQEQLGEIKQLRAQANQSAMQEAATQAADTAGSFAPDASVPTLDKVREKIEQRYATALGAQELTEASVGDRMAEIQQAGTDLAAQQRLAEIRAQLNGDESHREISGDTADEPDQLEAGHTEETADRS